MDKDGGGLVKYRIVGICSTAITNNIELIKITACWIDSKVRGFTWSETASDMVNNEILVINFVAFFLMVGLCMDGTWFVHVVSSWSSILTSLAKSQPNEQLLTVPATFLSQGTCVYRFILDAQQLRSLARSLYVDTNSFRWTYVFHWLRLNLIWEGYPVSAMLDKKSYIVIVIRTVDVLRKSRRNSMVTWEVWLIMLNWSSVCCSSQP